MGYACVSMETIGRVKDVVDRACRMKNTAMENVSASLVLIEGNVVYCNASHMKNTEMENVSASMDLIREDVVFVQWSAKVKVVV